MGYIDEEQYWAVEAIGIIFFIVGATKWLYDVIILDSFAHWKIYLIMIIVGVICAGYMKIGRALMGLKVAK
jgi:hypothetical protein